VGSSFWNVTRKTKKLATSEIPQGILTAPRRDGCALDPSARFSSEIAVLIVDGQDTRQMIVRIHPARDTRLPHLFHTVSQSGRTSYKRGGYHVSENDTDVQGGTNEAHSYSSFLANPEERLDQAANPDKVVPFRGGKIDDKTPLFPFFPSGDEVTELEEILMGTGPVQADHTDAVHNRRKARSSPVTPDGLLEISWPGRNVDAEGGLCTHNR
jgi:hypothetical protein